MNPPPDGKGNAPLCAPNTRAGEDPSAAGVEFLQQVDDLGGALFLRHVATLVLTRMRRAPLRADITEHLASE